MYQSLISNRTFQALENLYLNSKDMQDYSRDDYSYQPLAHAKEYCTIKLTTARRSGHSTAISKLITKYNNNWAIISHNQAMSERLIDNIRLNSINNNIVKITKSQIDFKNGNKTILITTHNFNEKLRGISLDGIIVDCACLLSQKKIEEIYKTGIPCMQFQPYRFFIFVE